MGRHKDKGALSGPFPHDTESRRVHIDAFKDSSPESCQGTVEKLDIGRVEISGDLVEVVARFFPQLRCLPLFLSCHGMEKVGHIGIRKDFFLQLLP